MSRLIDADAPEIQNCEGVAREIVLALIAKQPTVDAVPVVHAHWERYRDRTGLICSNCRGKWHWFEDKEYADIYARENKCCSNCGARMDEEVQTDA